MPENAYFVESFGIDTVARLCNRTWVTSDGRVMKTYEMEPTHALNALRFINSRAIAIHGGAVSMESVLLDDLTNRGHLGTDWLDRVAEDVNRARSSSLSEMLAWIRTLPGVRDWVDVLNASNLSHTWASDPSTGWAA